MHLIEIPAFDFDLEQTLNSGQVFHWEKAGNGFVGTIDNRAIYVEQRGKILRASGGGFKLDCLKQSSLSASVAHYFALDHPLAGICASFPQDPVMNAARDFCRGLRIIRQPKWECLATFICSSMKQVAHIRQISAALRNRFGRQRKIASRVVCTFPSPQRLAGASETELRECKLGYRAKNLRATAQLVSSGECNLEAWSALPDARLKDALCALPGVGAKIANCVMLFAYERLRAFPIDVWIERVLRQSYLRDRKKMTARRLREFSETYFGEHGGYAQQYLFHHARVTSRTSGVSRDCSTPTAFGARNDKRKNARRSDTKTRSRSRNKSKNRNPLAGQVVSPAGLG
jgi:N-glycosylase/DNA lyase